MVEYKIDVEPGVQDQLKKWQREMPTFMRSLMQAFASELSGLAAERAGNVLNVITGRLRTSVFARALGDSGLEIGAGSGVTYARIHEFGGTISAKGGGWLRFKGSRGWATVKSVYIPARPYVRPTVEEFFRTGAHQVTAAHVFDVHKRRLGAE